MPLLGPSTKTLLPTAVLSSSGINFTLLNPLLNLLLKTKENLRFYLTGEFQRTAKLFNRIKVNMPVGFSLK